MNCTFYNDPTFTYNAPINYNGVCVSPTPAPGGVGGLWNFEPTPFVAYPKLEEDEVVPLILAELLLDDE